MDIIFLIICAFLVIRFSKYRNSNDFRIAVLAIFGIHFFFVVKYSRFYADTFALKDVVVYGWILAFTIVVIGLASIPFSAKKSVLKSSILISLFVLFTSASFIFDKEIKVLIADAGGFFDGPILDSSIENNLTVAGSVSFKQERGGYGLSLPSDWMLRTHSSGLSFFEYSKGNAVIAELRPKCFHNAEISFVEAITAIEKHSIVEERQCFKDQEFYICLLKGRDGSQERWRWLAKSRNTTQAIELDFYFYRESETARNDALSIIDTMEIGPLAEPISSCGSPVDWL